MNINAIILCTHVNINTIILFAHVHINTVILIRVTYVNINTFNTDQCKLVSLVTNVIWIRFIEYMYMYTFSISHAEHTYSFYMRNTFIQMMCTPCMFTCSTEFSSLYLRGTQPQRGYHWSPHINHVDKVNHRCQCGGESDHPGLWCWFCDRES